MDFSHFSFDVGGVLAQENVGIHSDETRAELSARLAEKGAELMVKVVRDLETYKQNLKEQSEEGVTYGKSCVSLYIDPKEVLRSTSQDISQKRKTACKGTFFFKRRK